jgi:hypothetical protein
MNVAPLAELFIIHASSEGSKQCLGGVTASTNCSNLRRAPKAGAARNSRAQEDVSFVPFPALRF